MPEPVRTRDREDEVVECVDEDDEEPEGDAHPVGELLEYYRLDVTITPKPSTGKFTFREPRELMLVPFDAPTTADDALEGGACVEQMAVSSQGTDGAAQCGIVSTDGASTDRGQPTSPTGSEMVGAGTAVGREICIGVQELEVEFRKLPLRDRAMLAKRLVESLDDLSEARIEALWVDEAERRLDEMERGQVAEVPAEDVLCRVRAAISPP